LSTKCPFELVKRIVLLCTWYPGEHASCLENRI